MAYASPEQLRGEVVDARSDIYSFCAMLYELLTGRPPFDHDDPLVVIPKHLTREPHPLRDLAPSVPAALDAVVLQGLSKDPAARPPSMAALATALRAAVASSSVAGPGEARIELAREAPVVRGYELGTPVTKGRLGSQIYLGTHKALGTSVAIRILRREDVADWDAACERFLREARAMQVNHPNVIHVNDFGEEPDYVYVVTDFILGESLLQRLANDGPLAWPLLESLTAQLIDGVSALHRRGAFICGITPLTTRLTTEDGADRLLVSSGGVSQVQDLLGTASEGALRGTELRESELPYVAPEVLMGEAPSIAGDLFTIGAIVYTMATGTPPFLAPTMPQLLGAMLRGQPEPLTSIRSDVPASFSDAIMKTLSPVPTDRPADTRALALML